MEFYDILSSYYDDMTEFSKRLENDNKIFQSLFTLHPAQNILDLAAGTGLHTVLFSQQKKQVTAIEPSPEMLKIARKNAARYGILANFIQDDFLHFPQSVSDTFDAVFCLGNSFVHLLTYNEQLATMRNIHQVLNVGGYALIQIINYDKILKSKEMNLSIKVIDGVIFKRFYEMNHETISFHIKIKKASDAKEIVTELYPLKSNELRDLSLQAGFRDVSFFGDLKLNHFDPEISSNVIAILSG